MSMTLAEALRQVHLEPGRTYREWVDDKTVEVRVVPNPSAEETAAEPSAADGPPYIMPWVSFPPSERAVIVSARRGAPMLPKPIIIDESDLAPE